MDGCFWDNESKVSPSTPAVSPNGEFRFNIGEFGHRASLGIVDEAIAVEHHCVWVVPLIAHDSTHWDASNIANFYGETVGEGVRGDCFAA